MMFVLEPTPTEQVIAVINLMFCAVSGVILLCRLNSMTCDTKIEVRIAHVLGIGAMVFSVLRPYVGEWPGYASLMIAAYVLAELWASRGAWRGQHGDTPPESATVPAELREN